MLLGPVNADSVNIGTCRNAKKWITAVFMHACYFGYYIEALISVGVFSARKFFSMST